MNDQPRQKLVELFQARGEGLLHDPKQLEDLLQAQCPGYRPEVAALMNACRDGVPAALKAGPTSDETFVAGLKLRLQSNQSMRADAASWAVDVWRDVWLQAVQPSAPPEEKLEAKDVWDLIQILASFFFVGMVCLFVVIQFAPPVLGFFLDLKAGLLTDFGTGNYAGMIGKTVIAVIAGGIVYLVLSLAVKLLRIAKKTIVK